MAQSTQQRFLCPVTTTPCDAVDEGTGNQIKLVCKACGALLYEEIL